MNNNAMVASDAAIRQEVLETLHAAESVTRRAARCGLMLREKREALRAATSGAGGHPRAWHDGTKQDEDRFAVWIAKTIPELSKTTAYRWMEAAERVTKALKDSLPALDAPLSTVIDIDAEPETPEAAQARQLWMDFTQDKTLADILRDVTLEGDKPHRITRAHAGKTQGGTHARDNRKDWPAFVANGFLSVAYACGDNAATDAGKMAGGHWASHNDEQRAETKRLFVVWTETLPVELLVVLRDEAVRELKAREKGKAARPSAMRAAMSDLTMRRG